jgi:hypothetical protein
VIGPAAENPATDGRRAASPSYLEEELRRASEDGAVVRVSREARRAASEGHLPGFEALAA